MESAEPTVKPGHAALYRISATAVAIALTTMIGGAAVVAIYYPLRHAHFAFQWLLVFLMMTCESMAIHLPSEVILPVAGWSIVRDHHLGLEGIAGVSLVAAAGNTLGALLLYEAGRRGGRPLVRRYGRYVLVHESDIDAAERRIRSSGAWAVFVARLLPVVRTYVGFVSGMLAVPLPSYTVATFAGSLVWSAAFVWLGAALGAHWGRIEGPAEIAGIVVLALLAVALLAITAAQLRSRSAATHHIE
ncbi:MAG TPA: DedA family protein [Dehalococcoidia bacterium]|nr:DedA family protein [Dehalococcoidia bacterium]